MQGATASLALTRGIDAARVDSDRVHGHAVFLTEERDAEGRIESARVSQNNFHGNLFLYCAVRLGLCRKA